MEKHLQDMELAELEDFFVSIGEQRYRAKQLFRWISRGVFSFDEMSDLSGALKEKLKSHTCLGLLNLSEYLVSEVDDTRKYLFRLKDKHLIESVYMKYKHGSSVCISSQAGCAMSCTFCASGKEGLIRNLSAGELLEQVLRIQQNVKERISNVVVMGTGEPFENYESVSAFIKIVNNESGLNIGMRNITVSTCGIIPMIQRFSRDFPQVNLAVSLHSANETVRERLMPIAKTYTLNELLTACDEYVKATKRRITFEYALIDGVNSSLQCADDLSEKLKNILCHVNLIPLNSLTDSEHVPSSTQNTKKFLERLLQNGITATIRRKLGLDINAACGQLRIKQMQADTQQINEYGHNEAKK